MIMKIGIVAGEILNFLEEVKEPFNVDNIKSKIDYPGDLILMSLGWLVREGHIYIRNIDDKHYICCCRNDTIHCP